MNAYDSLLLKPRHTTVFAGTTAMMGGMPDPGIDPVSEENLFRAARGQQPILSGAPAMAGISSLTGPALGLAALVAVGAYFWFKR